VISKPAWVDGPSETDRELRKRRYHSALGLIVDACPLHLWTSEPARQSCMRERRSAIRTDRVQTRHGAGMQMHTHQAHRIHNAPLAH
jgi:hypothetical protein